MPVQTLEITGMICSRRSDSVEAALNALPGVRATVSLEEALARVESERPLDTERLERAVRARGFGARAFRRLGSAMTVLARSTLLSRFDAQLGAGLQVALEAKGIDVVTHSVPRMVRHEDGRFTSPTSPKPRPGARVVVRWMSCRWRRRRGATP